MNRAAKRGLAMAQDWGDAVMVGRVWCVRPRGARCWYVATHAALARLGGGQGAPLRPMPPEWSPTRAHRTTLGSADGIAFGRSCARSGYQRDLISGRQLWSGADLQGLAKAYGYTYARSRRALAARIRRAGGEVEFVAGLSPSGGALKVAVVRAPAEVAR